MKNETYITRMFSSIVSRYDTLNTILSLNMDKRWRKVAIAKTGVCIGMKALDVATGTGAMSIELAKYVGNHGDVTGIDLSRAMLQKACLRLQSKGYSNVNIVTANAQYLPFHDNTFDFATISFGLRNVSNIHTTLSEMLRTIKPGSKIVCLEFCPPKGLLLNLFFNQFLVRLLPLLGRILSGNNYAYRYLPLSIMRFEQPQEIINSMRHVGFINISADFQCMGLVAIYVGYKKH